MRPWPPHPYKISPNKGEDRLNSEEPFFLFSTRILFYISDSHKSMNLLETFEGNIVPQLVGVAPVQFSPLFYMYTHIKEESDIPPDLPGRCIYPWARVGGFGCIDAPGVGICGPDGLVDARNA